jgi:uncharacterized protein (DUF1778 family)
MERTLEGFNVAKINRSARSARLGIRVTEEQKNLFERAAAYTGQSVYDFVTTHAEAAAKKVVEQYRRLRLNHEQSRILIGALLSPRCPNRKLCRAAAKHRARVESR